MHSIECVILQLTSSFHQTCKMHRQYITSGHIGTDVNSHHSDNYQRCPATHLFDIPYSIFYDHFEVWGVNLSLINAQVVFTICQIYNILNTD
jgi:hypothetical protein